MNKLKFETQIENIKKYNESFICGEIPVFHSGYNRNMSHISKECAENMLETASYTPVLAEFRTKIDNNEEVSDFGSHGGRIVIDDNGIKFEETTVVIGCVMNEGYTIQELDGKDYYTLKVALYKERFPEIENIINNTQVNQSMEIALQEADYNDDGYVYVNKANLSGLCLLSESVEPCFSSSQLKTFSSNEEKFEFDYTEIIEKVKAVFEVKAEEDTSETEDFTETVETEPITETEFKEEEEEEEEEEEDTTTEPSDDNSDEPTKEEEEEEEEEEYKKEKDDEKKRKCEADEEEQFSMEDYKALIKRYSELEISYNSLIEEVEVLREFKKNIDDAENKAKVDEICNGFDLVEEEITEIREKAYNKEISAEALEDKLFALMGRKLLKSKNFTKENKQTVAKIKPTEIEEIGPYGSLTKYIKK